MLAAILGLLILVLLPAGIILVSRRARGPVLGRWLIFAVFGPLLAAVIGGLAAGIVGLVTSGSSLLTVGLSLLLPAAASATGILAWFFHMFPDRSRRRIRNSK